MRKSEGSIYQEKSGGWRGAICLGNGKRKTVLRKTRGEAVQAIRELLTLRDKNRPIVSSKRTVGQFMQEWLEVHVGPNKKPLTLQGYDSIAKLYIVPKLGKIRLDHLTGADVQAFLNECKEQGCAPKYVRNINGALKSSLRTAILWGYVEKNVAKSATPPTQVKYKAKPLTVEQADKLLGWLHLTEHRFEAFYFLAAMMGLRRGECLGLQWGDIDFKLSTIHVQHNCQRQKKKGMVLTTPKSEDSDALVPMPPLCATALLRRQQQQQRERKAAGEKWVSDLEFVFTSPKGKRLQDPDEPLEHLKAALALNGLPEVRLHDLRHTTASLLLAKGVHMKTIQLIMRHSSFAITADLYAHLAPTELAQTAQLMNGLFPSLNATNGATTAVQEIVQ